MRPRSRPYNLSRPLLDPRPPSPSSGCYAVVGLPLSSSSWWMPPSAAAAAMRRMTAAAGGLPSATASHRRGRSRATPWGRSRAVPLATTTPCHVVPWRRPPPRAVLWNAVGHHLARHPYAREREGGPALLLCTPMVLVGEDRAEERRRLACPGRERKEKEEKPCPLGKAWNLFVRGRDKDGSVGEIRLKLCLSFIGERG
jgi:hypothetical protein